MKVQLAHDVIVCRLLLDLNLLALDDSVRFLVRIGRMLGLGAAGTGLFLGDLLKRAHLPSEMADCQASVTGASLDVIL